MLLDSTRSQHLVRRFPLKVGDRAWVGVRRVHALVHRGLSFAVVDRGARTDESALEYAGQFARACQARLTLLVAAPGGAVSDTRVQAAQARLGGGLASLETRPFDPLDTDALLRQVELHPEDIVIVPKGVLGDGVSLVGLLHAGSHHVLLVPQGARPPRHVLICAAAGEPGKHDIFAAGRILRHLGALATILTVVHEPTSALLDQIARFHEASLRTLSLYGIEAKALVREGHAEHGILAAIREGPCDLLVLGSPLPSPTASGADRGLVDDLLDATVVPTLIVRQVG
jgi:hypothetical protein